MKQSTEAWVKDEVTNNYNTITATRQRISELLAIVEELEDRNSFLQAELMAQKAEEKISEANTIISIPEVYGT